MECGRSKRLGSLYLNNIKVSFTIFIYVAGVFANLFIQVYQNALQLLKIGQASGSDGEEGF